MDLDLFEPLYGLWHRLRAVGKKTEMKKCVRYNYTFSDLTSDLRLLLGICFCTERFLLQDLPLESEENDEVHQTLESFFNDLRDSINEKLWEIEAVCSKILDRMELIGNSHQCCLFSSIVDVVETLKPLFGKAIDKYLHLSQPKHGTMKELLDFIVLVSEDGKETHSGSSLKSLQLQKLDFLKKFIRFAASRGVGEDKLQDLFAHTQAVVIITAFCSYMLWRPQVTDETTRSLIYSRYSEMLQKLPVVIQEATRSICSSDYTRMDDDDDDDDVLGAFIKFLLETQDELLFSKARITCAVPLILIKELRFLRIFLMDKRPDGANLDEEITNLICEVVSEAVMLYSLSLDDLNEDSELGLSNWMEKVQLLKQDVAKRYPKTSTCELRSIHELGSVLMAPKLSDLIDTLQSYLAWLKDFLGSTNEWRAFRPIEIALTFMPRIFSCLEMFFLQDLTSESDDRSFKFFLVFLGVAIKNEAWEIYSVIQEITKNFELGKVDNRRISQEHVIIFSSSFCRVVEILKLFLFGKALDKFMHSAESKHCTTEELLDCIQLILEDGKKYQGFQLHKLEFLKNFISFAASRGIGQDKLQDLSAHAAVLVTTAAYCSYICWEPEVTDPTTNSLIFFQYEMLEVQLKVGESYIRVLKELESSCSLDYTKVDDNIVGAFIDSLLENLPEILASKSGFTASSMKILIEELRFLRNFLIYKRQEGGNLDEVMANLICNVVIEAEMICYSLSWDDLKEVPIRDTKLGLSNWMGKAKLLSENVVKKYPETSRYKFPRTNELGFMDGLLEDLEELIGYNPDSIAFAQGQLDVVLEDLVFLRDFLRDMVKQHNEHEELKALWFRVVDIAYMSEFVINSLVVGDPSPDCSPSSFNTIKEEIKKIRAQIKEIHMGRRFQIEALNTTNISRRLPSRSSNQTMDEVVGFEDEAKKIIGLLEANSPERDIVSIVGMPGLGKTTLAKKVYNDLKSRFHVCAWCCVSQGYQKRKLLVDMLSDLDKLPTGVHEKSDEDLEEVLYQSLKGRKYLIFLDDLWDIEAWHSLQSCFPNDHNQSRILITSRIQIEGFQAHSLRSLFVDESKELLQKLLHNKGYPEKLGTLGMKIAKICKGLPLAVVTVAGMLATMEQDCWEGFAARLTTSFVNSTEECTELLELSYIHLPDHLKPCLLYFGSFLQDEEIPVSRLIWSWMVEGFVQKNTDENSLENVAMDYLNDLINRSLVMVVKRTSRDGIKACHVHDLVHQFCEMRAKEENFLHIPHLQGKTDILSEPRRLCIGSWDDNYLCFRRVSSLKFFPYRYCNFLIEVPSILRSFKILNVLDLRNIYCFHHFPFEVVKLVHLRFLSLAGDFDFVPSTIVKLWNLETFLLTGSWGDISLPYTLLNMTKLRHMRADNNVIFSLPEQNLEKCCESSNLETFSTPVLSSRQDMVKIIRKMPYLRKLKCTFFGSWDSQEVCQFPALDFLSQLESLKVACKAGYPLEFSFPVTLKKVTLSNFYLSRASISRLAQLPELEVLKLLNGACEVEAWDMKAGEVFKKLQFLKFEDLDIVDWIACSDYFPLLQQLVLHKCRKLRGITIDIEELDCLKIVDVKFCHSSIATWAQDLEQIEGLKVFIHVPVDESPEEGC